MNRTLPGIARSCRYDKTRIAISAIFRTMAASARRRIGIMIDKMGGKDWRACFKH
jgi:hypothetical protein